MDKGKAIKIGVVVVCLIGAGIAIVLWMSSSGDGASGGGEPRLGEAMQVMTRFFA